MSVRYIQQHAQAALLSLALAQKEAAHLHYSHSTLFSMPIDLATKGSVPFSRAMHSFTQAFLDSLLAANEACKMFFEIINNAQVELKRLGLTDA